MVSIYVSIYVCIIYQLHALERNELSAVNSIEEDRMTEIWVNAQTHGMNGFSLLTEIVEL